MSVIQIRVDDQQLAITNMPVIASGGIEENQIEFDFSSDWDGFACVACFYRDNKAYSSFVSATGVANVPHEVTATDGKMWLGVMGVHSGVTKTSELVFYKILQGAITEDFDPGEPTPDIYNQILDYVSDAIALEQRLNSVENQSSNNTTNIAAQTGRIDNMISSQTNAEVKTLWNGSIDKKNQTATLSESIANFDFIDVYVMDSDSIFIRKPVTTNMKYEIQAQNMSDDASSQFLRWWETELVISGTTATITHAIKCYWDDFTQVPVVSEATQGGSTISRIDGVKIGHIEDDEIVDARVGYDGTQYETLGGSVRGQANKVLGVIGKTTQSLNIITGHCVNDDGSITTSSSYSYGTFAIDHQKALHVYTHMYAGSCMAFYDIDDVFISAVKNMSTADNYLFDGVVSVPDGAKYLKVSCLTPSRLEMKVYSTVVEDLNGIVEYVDRKDNEAEAINQGRYNEVSSDLDNFENDIAEYVISQNKYKGIYTLNRYVNQTDGTLGENSTYSASDFIKIDNPTNKIVIYNHTQNSVRYALYTEADETTFVRGAMVSETLDAESNLYYVVIDVTGTKYIRFSMATGNFTDLAASKLSVVFGDHVLPYVPYVQERWIIKDVGVSGVLDSSVVGYYPQHVEQASLTNNTKLAIPGSNSIKKNKVYHFRANIDDSFDALYVGHGEGDYSLYFRINGTTIAFMGNGSVETELPHGLTLDTYIDFILIVGNKSEGKIILNTLGGTYTRVVQTVQGYKGEIFMRPYGCSVTNAYVGFSCSDFRQPIWMFGDSYFTHTSQNRWCYWLSEWGFDRCMINAFPGEASSDAINQFINYVPSCGVPKYAVWCMGMNDPDSSSAINATWENVVEQFLLMCEQNGITPIFATIPNVPSYSNYYKNQWVRNSGYRYIDFAKAVGAEEVGSHWYDGALSEDNVHPSEIGARMLCLQAIEDIPELTLGNI